MDASGPVLLYADGWKVEWYFRTNKGPTMVGRLFIEESGRTDAPVNKVSQPLIGRVLESIPGGKLPRCGYGPGPLQRKVTTAARAPTCP